MRGRFRGNGGGVSARRGRNLSWLAAFAAAEGCVSVVQELELRGLTKCYAGRDEPTLAGVDLVLPRGESAAVRGRPESGLTTLATTVAGTTSYGGDVLVDGRPRWGGEVGFVTAGADEELGRDNDLTVREFLRRRFVGSGQPRRRADGHAWGAIRDFELEGIADERVGFLCHLDRFRLRIALALMAVPPFLVVDEPERDQGLLGAHSAVDYMLDMTRAAYCGVLYVTKSVGQAAAAEQWFDLRDGRLHDLGDAPVRLRVVGQ